VRGRAACRRPVIEEQQVGSGLTGHADIAGESQADPDHARSSRGFSAGCKRFTDIQETVSSAGRRIVLRDR